MCTRFGARQEYICDVLVGRRAGGEEDGRGVVRQGLRICHREERQPTKGRAQLDPHCVRCRGGDSE